MKAFFFIATIALLGLGTILEGCGKAELGGGQSAGPFRVTLTTDPQPPVAGPTDLIVKVSKDGKEATDASVGIESSMPDMNMPGPSMDLHRSGSAYVGTLNMMAGKWEVKVNVAAGADKGSATFGFEVK